MDNESRLSIKRIIHPKTNHVLEPILYQRPIKDNWRYSETWERTIEMYGIKNDCCKVTENITYSPKNEFLICIQCKRLFKWKPIVKKAKFTTVHKESLGFGIAMGIGFSICAGVGVAIAHFVGLI